MPAAARTKYPTSSSFSYSPLLMAGFTGNLDSPILECLDNRKVAVFKVRSGSDSSVGDTRSESDGSWFVPKKKAGEAKYYVKVRGKDLGGGDSCKPYRSPSKRFEEPG
jgi:hypothetical protein